MQAEERLEQIARIWHKREEINSFILGIGHELKGILKTMDDIIGGTDKIDDKKLRAEASKIKKSEAKRSLANKDKKNLNADLEACIFEKGKFDKNQLHFPKLLAPRYPQLILVIQH